MDLGGRGEHLRLQVLRWRRKRVQRGDLGGTSMPFKMEC
jgi:hypothetical protein